MTSPHTPRLLLPAALTLPSRSGSCGVSTPVRSQREISGGDFGTNELCNVELVWDERDVIPGLAELERASETRIDFGLDNWSAYRCRSSSQIPDPEHLDDVLQEVQKAAGIWHQSMRKFRPLRSYVREYLPNWTIVVLIMSALALTSVEFFFRPNFSHQGQHMPHWMAYFTIMGLVAALTLLVNGMRSEFVYIFALSWFAAVGIIDKAQVLGGLVLDGAWIPQLLLIIIKGIQDSGFLEDLLTFLLGGRPSGPCCYNRGRCGRIFAWSRLSVAIIGLAAMLGAGPTITLAAPVVVRWARSYKFRVRPILMLLVGSASCGNVVLLSSNPVSMLIRSELRQNYESECSDVDICLSLATQAPLGFALSFILGVYFIFAAPLLLGKGDDLSLGDDGNRTTSPSSNSSVPTLGFRISQKANSELRYRVEFVVEARSSLCGRTPTTSGVAREEGIHLLMICRSDCYNRSIVTENDSFGIGDQRPEEGHWRATDSVDIANWVFQSGDVICARCSARGVCTMRQHRGVFALRGIHCHYLLGGRRHERRLYECVVGTKSPIVGRTLEELVGLQPGSKSPAALSFEVAQDSGVQIPWFVRHHHGYPLAARRDETERPAEPLSPAHDRLTAGDVLLVDSFEDFPHNLATARDFLVVALVPNSQAPRHGRPLDRWRGLVAISGLICVIVLADFELCSLLLGLFIVAVALVFFQIVHPDQVLQCLSWSLMLIVMAGQAISMAVLNSGLADTVANGLNALGRSGGCIPVFVCLAVTTQILGNVFSNVAAGLIVTPVVMALGQKAPYWKDYLFSMVILVIVCCNMILSTPYGTAANASLSRIASFKKIDFLRVGVPAQLITTVVVVIWVWYFGAQLSIGTTAANVRTANLTVVPAVEALSVII